MLVYRADGHAGYGDPGKDIVCASTSILAMTLAETLSKANKCGWIGNDAIVELTPEETEVSCVTEDEEVFGELARRYLTVVTGYELLARHYPNHVKFETEIRL